RRTSTYVSAHSLHDTLPISTTLRRSPRRSSSTLDHLCDPDAELVVHDHHVATRHQRPIDDHVHRGTRGAVQVYDSSLLQGQKVPDFHRDPTQLHGDLETDVTEDVDVLQTTGAGAGAELGKGGGGDGLFGGEGFGLLGHGCLHSRIWTAR